MSLTTVVINIKVRVCSRLALIVVHRHVFVPIVSQDLPWQSLLLFIGELEPALLLEELFILLLETESHIISISLGVTLRESETPHHWLGLFEDFLDFVGSALLHLHETLLKSLVKADTSHLLDDRFSTHYLDKARLQSDFINDRFERIWLVVSKVGQNFSIKLNI